MLLRTAAFKKSHLDFGNEDSALTISRQCIGTGDGTATLRGIASSLRWISIGGPDISGSGECVHLLKVEEA